MNGRQLLKRYLKATGQTISGLSRESGLDNAMLYRWLNGKRRPGLDSATKLERVTRGDVPASAWVNGS